MLRLRGTYPHSLDGKSRVVLPGKLRAIIGDKFTITKGDDKCLSIYTAEMFDSMEDRLMELPNTPEARRVIDEKLGNAQDCEVDKQGRFVVPAVLKKLANISEDVYIIGKGDHAEIWDVKEHEAFQNGESEDSMSFQEASRLLNEKGYYF